MSVGLLLLLPFAFVAALPPGDAPRVDIESLTEIGEVGAVTLFFLLAAATMVSEDATCVAAGLLVAQGGASFGVAAGGSLFGIFFGDLLLFLAGRFVGRPALRLPPFKWFVRAGDVARSSEWFARRGAAVILLSRFLPGTRLPTYFAAGLLETSFWKFSLYFLLAAAAWTPLVVGLAAAFGAGADSLSLLSGRGALAKLLLAGAVAFVCVRLALRLASFRGRRLLVSRWRRLTRWEFWPPYVFYPPVVAYVLLLGLRHRCLTLFTCTNPAIPSGGFVGESKIEILRGLSSSGWARGHVARAVHIDSSLTAGGRLRAARDFMASRGLAFPLVVKPDAGQRGEGVRVVRSECELEEVLRGAARDVLVQEYAPGFEFGVFYYRRPGERRGHIFSITEKRFPAVVGDGRSTLEELILKDERAVCMAKTHMRQHASRLGRVPARGESSALVEVGSHCRGALFLDGSRFKTAALERSIDRLSRGFDGFYFGRFDLRTPSVEDFRQGRNFKVVELNGVTSEATHIYDPRHGPLEAYGLLFRQWRLAFEIGARNRARGARPTPLLELLGLTYRGTMDAE
ncbi:MAG TPA: VTT domain-containing protein [Pyrinomonadaceae bacterium]|nr:VTT domain-containing protein [Pyrinomonadaceae bacterium]